MSILPGREEAIFLAAREKRTHLERIAYLDGACAGDVELRNRVLELLKSHDESEGPFDVPPPGLQPTNISLEVSATGNQIGPYKLLEQIGEGGFGVVYMADQQEPVRRKVALKIIKPGMDTKQVLARFKAELHALAMMDHPNIARALDAGATDSGRPYFVMELVRGVPITEYCDHNNLAVHERLDLFVQVCHAVQHAHQKGIIHRDIKPSNVLVTMQDGRPVPKVIDFGVAKAINQQLTQETIFTRFAEMIGTPLYMSPEQAEMTTLDIDTRSDIYSLGVLLYELLTGTTPFEKERLKQAAFDEIRRIIREEEPAKPSTRISTLGPTSAAVAAHRHADPRRLGQLMRGDLDWIVMKALEKDRTRRYETANGLAMDLQRHLADEPVLAGPPSAMYRFRKFARRNRTSLAMATVVTVALLLGIVGTTWQAIQAMHERDRAYAAEHLAGKRLEAESRARAAEAEQRQLAVAGKAEATRQLYVAQINLAWKAWDEKNVGRTRELLQKLEPKFTGEADLRGWEWNYLWRLSHSELRTLKFPSISLAFTPDGRSLISGNWEGVLKMWDADGDRETWSIAAHADRIDRLAVTNDGKLLATRSPDGTVKLWDIATRRILRTYVSDKVRYSCLAFSPDGTRLAMNAPGLSLWSTEDGPEITRFEGQVKCEVVAFSPDGHQLATTPSHFSSTSTLWEVPTGQKVRDFCGGGARATAIAFSPDGQFLTIGYRDGSIKTWNVATGQEFSEFRGHTDGITRVLFSRDGKQTVTASGDTTIKVWDTATAQKITTLRGHESGVSDVSISPSGDVIASGGWDGTIRFWDAASRQEPRKLEVANASISSVAFSPDGMWLAIGCEQGTKVVDASTGLPLRRAAEGSSSSTSTRAVCFHPDGQMLASGLSNGDVEVQSVSDGRLVRTIDASDSVVGAVSFSRDGRLLATGSRLHEVAVWNVLDGRRVTFFEGHTDGVSTVAFSPDGKYLASGALEKDKTVILWDIATGRKVHRLSGHEGAVQCVQFSHDGKQVFSGSTDEMIRVWDVETGATVHVHRAHAGTTFGLALSPDGRRLASCSSDQCVKLWDASTWQELQTLNTQGGALHSVAFSPDGMRLAAGGTLRFVSLWDSRPLTDELRVELAAADRVESLFAEHLLPKPVIRALNDDPMISDALRKKSLELAERRHVDPYALNDRSWTIAKQPGLTADRYHLAVRCAQAACELHPENGALQNTLGIAHYRAGDWKAAIAALEKSMELRNGGDMFDWFFLAMAHWQLGEKDSASKWYKAARLWTAKYQPQNEELARYRAEAAALMGLPETEPVDKTDELALGEALVAASPQASSYRLRGEAFANAEQWDRAADDFTKAIELGDKVFLTWYQRALVRRAKDDKPGFQSACADMLKQFARAADTESAHFVAWSCALGPEALTDFAPAVALAEKAVKLDAKSARFAEGVGAILYRAGRFDEARRKLEEADRLHSATETNPSSPAYTWFFLAMTHHRLGHVDEAKQWFDKARQQTDKALNEHDAGTAILAWNRRLTLNLLRNEAEALLGMKPAPAASAAITATKDEAPVEARKP